jgi:hypothetical protein
MANIGRGTVVAVAAMAVLACAQGVWGAERQEADPVVVITIENDANAADSTLVEAERRATRIYAAAGIRTIWVNSSSDADAPASARHLRVVLLTREMRKRGDLLLPHHRHGAAGTLLRR